MSDFSANNRPLPEGGVTHKTGYCPDLKRPVFYFPQRANTEERSEYCPVNERVANIRLDHPGVVQHGENPAEVNYAVQLLPATSPKLTYGLPIGCCGQGYQQ